MSGNLKLNFDERVKAIVEKARAHGVEISPGEEFLVTLEKLIARLDLYRDKPQSKGRLIIE